MKEFEIFRVLVLYNFELKQKHSSHNSQSTIGSHLKIASFMFSCTLTKMCVIVESNHQNRVIVLVEQKTNKHRYTCFSELMAMSNDIGIAYIMVKLTFVFSSIFSKVRFMI